MSLRHVIKDNAYPCPNAGDLKWQPESDSAENGALQALKEFLVAVEKGEKEAWLNRFFDMEGAKPLFSAEVNGDQVPIPPGYPKLHTAEAILDIFSKFRRSGHSVYRCPECERIYIQKEYRSDEYSCYEKRAGYSRS